MRGHSLVAASGGHSSSRCMGLSLSRPLLLRSTGSRRTGSVIVAHRPSCSAACGIFPDQGPNPCPLHWQADSQPLRHQGSPSLRLLKRHCPLYYTTSRFDLEFAVILIVAIFFNLFIYFILFLAVLGLRFCVRTFSSCGKWGPSSSWCAGLSLSRPRLLRSTGSRHAGSVIVAHRPSCSAACGIFQDQGSNPCPLHWQADSQPLRHQGSPDISFFHPFTFHLCHRI